MEGDTAGDKGASMMCVHCGTSARSVYVEYSPGNIRLSTCARCHSPVDEYVEYETLIVVIDAILHKPEAYRHLFFNYPELHRFNLLNLIWKAILVDLLLDTCRCALQQGIGNKEVIQWDSLTSFVSTLGKVVAQMSCLNCAFQLFLFLAVHAWPRREPDVNLKSKHILLAVLLSSHFKLVVFAMLVWEFSPLMNFTIDMLVFSSNIVAMKVMLKTTTAHAAVAIMSGAAAKTFVATLLGISALNLFNLGKFYSRLWT
ncbi:unnamed protein product [Calypogeia fissa]